MARRLVSATDSNVERICRTRSSRARSQAVPVARTPRSRMTRGRNERRRLRYRSRRGAMNGACKLMRADLEVPEETKPGDCPSHHPEALHNTPTAGSSIEPGGQQDPADGGG